MESHSNRIRSELVTLCGSRHAAEVALDADEYPLTRWLDAHRDDLDEALDRLGEAAGVAFADAISNGHLRAAETSPTCSGGRSGHDR